MTGFIKCDIIYAYFEGMKVMTMDSIAIFWLCSILFSAAGKVVCAFAVLKEAADSGYKFVLDENLPNKFKTSEVIKGYFRLI